MVLQRFLEYNCKEICQGGLSQSSALVEGASCIFHKGMERSETQSFLSCIADIYHSVSQQNVDIAEKLSPDPPISITEMKDIIANLLNIDNFITLQNGGLVSAFYKSDEDIDVEPYKESVLYTSIKTPSGEVYFKMVVYPLRLK